MIWPFRKKYSIPREEWWYTDNYKWAIVREAGEHVWLQLQQELVRSDGVTKWEDVKNQPYYFRQTSKVVKRSELAARGLQ